MVDDPQKMRLEALQQMLAGDPDDPFALYGLAVELKVMDRADESEPLLRRLLQVEPTQLYGYYQLGEILIADGEFEDAEAVLLRGIAQAEAAGDAKAENELRGLMDLC